MFQSPLIMWDNSKVSLELRELVENGVNIWDFDYPSFYQGEEKTAFEKKVIDHYYFRQIGQETPGRWLHYFRTRIREIMPYYKQIYESVKIMEKLDDPFGNVDITETFSQITQGESSGESSSSDSSSGESSRTSSGSSDATRKFSNTPQGSIDNLDEYLTEASIENGTNGESSSDESSTQGASESTSSSSSSGSTEYTLTKKGNQGVNTYAHDMKELRETYLNIDMMMINELKDLFLMVY